MKRYLVGCMRVGGFSFAAIIVSAFGALFFIGQPVYAEMGDWLLPGVTAEVIQDPLENTPRLSNHTQQCRWQDILIGNSLVSLEGCVYYAKSFRLAYTKQCISNWYGSCDNDEFMAISIGSDSKFYRVRNMAERFGYYYWQVSPESDRLISTFGRNILVIDDMVGNLTSELTPAGREYTINPGAQTYLTNSKGNPVAAGAAVISANGEWLVGEAVDLGLFRMRLSDGLVLMFTRNIEVYGRGSDPSYEFSITNDGRYVVVGGQNVTATFYQLGDGCGKSTITFWRDWTELGYAKDFPGCPSVRMNDLLAGVSEVNHDNVSVQSYRYFKFNEDGATLEFQEAFYQPVDEQWERWVKLYAPGYVKSPYLDYLALGDSYSSGEGDNEGDGSHYLSGMAGDKQCHLSDRSYPFLLRSMWGIDKANMQSIACSGALVLPDMYGSPINYMGQGRRLVGRTPEERENIRIRALDNFYPGIVQQTDFVKKYKPEIITLTGGGNDIGFANILKYCAMPGWEHFAPLMDDTCWYARDSEMRASLNRTIDNQYELNKRLIEKIQALSPRSKIYIISYPQFVADGLGCLENSMILNKAERLMIREGVKRLNNTLKKVARDTKVFYVDIEDSLAGGQICEGSMYMADPVATIIQNMSIRSDSNMYHPNAHGHVKMAGAIEARVRHGLDYQIDEIPNEADGSYSIWYTILTSFANLGSNLIAEIEPGVLKPGTSVKISIHSTTKNLAEAITANDGSVDVQIKIPKEIGVGYHLLTAEGISNEGEPVILQQVVPVTSGINDDADSDGIPDKEDACFVVSEWIVNSENICLTQRDIGPSDSTYGQKSTTTDHDIKHSNSGVSNKMNSLLLAVNKQDSGFMISSSQFGAVRDIKGSRANRSRGDIASASAWQWMVSVGGVVVAILVTGIAIKSKHRSDII